MKKITASLKSLDMFAQPVTSFNIHGHEKVQTKVGGCFGLFLRIVLIYAIGMSTVQILSYKRFTKGEKIEYGDAATERLDFREQLANMAFRATDVKKKLNNIDPKIAKWKVRLVTSSLGNTADLINE